MIDLPPGTTTTTTDSSTKFMAAARVGTKVRGERVALHRGRTTIRDAGEVVMRAGARPG